MTEISETAPIAPAKEAPLLNGTLLLFMLAMILANIGGNMYGPLLPLYLKSLNASVLHVGLFFTLSQIVPLALQILGGWISDTLGRLRSIAMGSVAGVLSYVGLLLAPTWQWVLLGEGLNAVTRSLVGPSFDAFIAENSSEQNRARVFGITQTLFMIVSVVGPPLGSYLVAGYGFKAMILVAGIFYFMATVIRVRMARAASNGHEANPQRLSLSSLRSNLGTMFGLVVSGGLITWILLTDGIRDVSFALSGNLMPLYLEGIGGLSYVQIGWLNSIFGIAMMSLAVFGGWLADKKGERTGIAVGFGLVGAALLVFLQAASFWGFAASWGLFGMGVGLMSPAYQSLISKAVPAKVRGTAFGLFSTSLGLISLPAPWLGAQLWEMAGPRVPFLITAIASFIIIIPAWLKFRLPPKTEAENSNGS